MKELWVETFEQLIGEYLETHPDTNYIEAYSYAALNTDDALADRLAVMSDRFREDYLESLL